jgi:hypothetical protein
MNEDYIPIPAYICISILSMVFAYASLDEQNVLEPVVEPIGSFTDSLPSITNPFSNGPSSGDNTEKSILPSLTSLNPFSQPNAVPIAAEVPVPIATAVPIRMGGRKTKSARAKTKSKRRLNGTRANKIKSRK